MAKPVVTAPRELPVGKVREGSTHRPAVTVILPTYNRRRFLTDALQSIATQTFADWELLVVDDGSTDESGALIGQLTSSWPQSVRYVFQENAGAYAARNRGVELSQGHYIAFFDSDDLWLPHHLEVCVRGLVEHPRIDWVYGARQIVAGDTGSVLAPSEFYVDGRPRPFLQLDSRPAGALRIIEDRGLLECSIMSGLCCGLQNSVIRRSVFDHIRLDDKTRNGADRMLAIRAIKRGHVLAFHDAVHVVYKVHADNSSVPGGLQRDSQHRAGVLEQIIGSYERLLDQEAWTSSERALLRRRLLRETFWILGYSIQWESGNRVDALRTFRRGLRHWPWNWRPWKTYLWALARTTLAPRPETPSPGQLPPNRGS